MPKAPATLVSLILAVVAAAAPAGDPERTQIIDIDATVTAVSDFPTLKQIAPYHEALVVYEWEVKTVHRGKLRHKTIRVAHWAWYERTKQHTERFKVGSFDDHMLLVPLDSTPELRRMKTVDTLDPDPGIAMFHDVTKPLKAPGDDAIAGRLGDQLKRMLNRRRMVRLVAIGDSRTERGIRPGLFYDGQGEALAGRLATGGLPIPSFELAARQCVLALPNLEWIVHGFSPRLCSTGWGDNDVKVLAGPAWPATGKKSGETGKLPTRPIMNPAVADRAAGHAAAFSTESWALFEWTARELDARGVKLLIWTPPLRADYHGHETVDDGTPFYVWNALKERLRGLERLYPNVHFLDVNRGGRHEFQDHEFADPDHLNEKGAARLTRMLDAYRADPVWCGQRLVGDTTNGLEWARLHENEKVYVDRDYVYQRVPEKLRLLPALRTRNDDKKRQDAVVVSFRLHVEADIYIFLTESQPAPKWMKGFTKTDMKTIAQSKRYVVYVKRFGKGAVKLGPLHDPSSSRSMYTVVVDAKEADGTQ